MSFAVRAQPQAVEHTLAWSAFYGGVLYDAGHAAVADADGNMYVAGISQQPWGKDPVNPFNGGEYDDNDVLVAKFDRRGQLVWHTFLGAMDPNTPKTIGTAHTPLRWTRRAAGPVM